MQQNIVEAEKTVFVVKGTQVAPDGDGDTNFSMKKLCVFWDVMPYSLVHKTNLHSHRHDNVRSRVTWIRVDGTGLQARLSCWLRELRNSSKTTTDFCLCNNGIKRRL
jgi:hypothetical protein